MIFAAAINRERRSIEIPVFESWLLAVCLGASLRKRELDINKRADLYIGISVISVQQGIGLLFNSVIASQIVRRN